MQHDAISNQFPPSSDTPATCQHGRSRPLISGRQGGVSLEEEKVLTTRSLVAECENGTKSTLKEEIDG